MFCAKCHLYVLGMMDELVVLITKDKLLHLGFEAIITYIRLGKNLKIVVIGLGSIEYHIQFEILI